MNIEEVRALSIEEKAQLIRFILDTTDVVFDGHYGASVDWVGGKDVSVVEDKIEIWTDICTG